MGIISNFFFLVWYFNEHLCFEHINTRKPSPPKVATLIIKLQIIVFIIMYILLSFVFAPNSSSEKLGA